MSNATRRTGHGLAITALPEAKEVRVITSKRKLALTPTQARGVAYTLLTLADVAERRAIPNQSQELAP